MDSPMRGDGSSRELSHAASVKVLADLLARVEAAEGPDPGLDGRLDALVDHEGEAWPARYTASLDAALALVARKLPGARVCLTHEPGYYGGAEILMGRNRSERHLGGAERADGETALALIAALLRALIAQAEASPTGQSAERNDLARDVKNPIAKGAGE